MLSRRRLGDLDVDLERPGVVPLDTSADHIFGVGSHCPPRTGRRSRLIPHPGERETAPLSKKIGNEVVCEGFYKVLLLWVAGEVAQRGHGHGNAGQARPLWPRFHRERLYRQLKSLLF
jgi:hypothetical protein